MESCTLASRFVELRLPNFRAALVVLVALLALMTTPWWVQRTTPTEALALRRAAVDRPAYTLPPDKLKPAQELFRARTALHFAGEGWGILQLLMLLALGVPARMRNVAENLTKNRWAQCFVFVFLFLLTWLVGSLLVMVLFWVIRKSPKHWWFWFWIPTMAGVLFGVFVSPILVDPMFNRFEPLQQRSPALVEQLERVVARSGVSLPPDRMFFMQASQKVTSLNAYVTGFGPSKRLVLWDTTIASSTPDELSGIFGHELGHYALHHIVLGLLFTAALLLVAWAFVAVLALGLNALNFFSEPIDNAFSRSIEHAADVYGQEAIHGIVADPQTTVQRGFQRLGETSLDDPTPHPFVDFWTSSHPSTADRAAFAAAYNPWATGQHPKYF